MNLSRWCVFALLGSVALGCSDPVPPAPQVAAHVTLSPASVPASQGTCSEGPLTFLIPAKAIDEDALPSAERKGPSVADGDGADVACKVKGSGTFVFEGTVSSRGNTFTITGTLDANHKGTARVTENAANQTTLLASSDCTVTANPEDGGGYQVKAGSIWGHYLCPTVKSSNTPGITCESEGWFVFENCEK